jgi:oligosaccharide repeat unit polymerase
MIVSPAFVFIIMWFSVVFLYSLGLSNVLQPLKAQTIYLISISGIFLLLGSFLARLWIDGPVFKKRFINSSTYFDFFTCKVIKKRVVVALQFWLVFTFVEILVFSNLPLLSALGVGPSIRYTEFGFPGVHGLLNALYFVILLYFVGNFFFSRKKRSLLVIILLLIWPFLVMHRMMVIASFLQIVFLTLILNQRNLNFRSYFKYIISLLSIILVFGYLGDFRSGREHILQLANLTVEYPEWLPSAFAWVYLYVTTPINNINYSIEIFEYPSLFPVELLSRIFPSFVRDYLFNVFGYESESQLVTNAFNVSTVFLPVIKDFGYVFAPLLFFLIGFLSFLLVLKSYSNPRYLFFWVILLYSIVISVFSNHMFHLVFWFEALFGFYLFRRRAL